MTSKTKARGTSILRALLVLDMLRGLRHGLTPQAISEALAERIGRKWHWRTCRRDAQVLVAVGLVERNDDRFRIVPKHPAVQSLLTALLPQAAIGGAA